MSWELFNRLIYEGREMGMHFCTISGGETFLWPHLFRAASEYPDVQFHIYTNGTLIAPESHELAQKIHGDYLSGSVAETIAKLGNMNVSISVEGLAERTNARRGVFRGIPVWSLIMSAMDALTKAGCIFAYSVTETAFNIDEIHPPDFVEGQTSEHPFIDTMIEKGCLLGWHFNFIPCGKNATLDVMPTPLQRDQARRGTLRVRATKPIIPLHFWNDGHLVGGCMAGGKLYLHVLANGDVEPCVFVHFAVLNVRDKPLKEVLNSPFFRAIRERQPFNNGNHLRPCMIIDAPSVLRELVAQFGARPTHQGAETIITDLADGLDHYTKEYGKLADPAWEQGYNWVKSGKAGVPR
jgi:MoaA/NifB/PqqE/SkfB family radical SAM enzyme